MNIVLIHDGYGPLRGSEKVALDLMAGLGERGFAWHVMTNHAAFHSALTASGIAAELMPFRRLLVDPTRIGDWRQSFRCYRRLRRLIGEFKPAAVHINNGGACQWAVPAAALEGIPSLVHLHAPWSRKMRFLLGLHHPDYIVGVSRAILAGMAGDSIAAKRLRVIYNGIHEPAAAAAGAADRRRALGIRQDQYVVALVGVLIAQKRPADAIAALRLLARQHGDACLLLVIGDGPERQRLEAQARDLPVIFLGQRSDVIDLMRGSCDAVVLPSQIEAFSLVLLEAAVSGLPRIASDAGGNVESIRHLEDGLIVPLGDADALAGAIARLRAEPALAAELARRARARALEEFSAGAFVDNFEQLYRQIAQAGRIGLAAKIVDLLRSNFNVLFRRAAVKADHVQS